MEVVNKKILLVVILIGIFSCIFMWQNISDNKTILEEVALNLNEKNNMFAIMLEQEDGTYEESDDNMWPTSSIHLYDEQRSRCMDVNGNKIENALTYDTENKIASVKTEKTSYCYLYFSIPKICETGTQVGECLLNNPTLALNTSMEGGLYRYQGSEADNYICFGTSDIDECLNNKDKYLYRVVGIDSNGKLKLIKNTRIGTYEWYSNNTSENITWPNSDLYKGLNGINSENITPIFVDNNTYDYMETDNEWYNKIASVEWKYGNTTSTGNFNAETMLAFENSWLDSINAKIGLLYLSDYYYAYGIGGNPGTSEAAKNTWIIYSSHMYVISNSTWSSIYNTQMVPSIYPTGEVYYVGTYTKFAIRPVFHIISDMQYILGLGTKNCPFIIE